MLKVEGTTCTKGSEVGEFDVFQELKANQCDQSVMTGGRVGEVGVGGRSQILQSFLGYGEKFEFHPQSNEKQLKGIS